MNTSLQVHRGDEVVFEHDGHWLYPLFALEAWLKSRDITTTDLLLHDKIAGKAAAMLICKMGFRHVHIDLISGIALAYFQAQGVSSTYTKLVPKIQCRTEDWLKDETEEKAAYRFLKKRAKLIHGMDVSVKNLSVAYSQQLVFSNLNLKLHAGDAVILQGDNGCGKTTLIHILLGMLSAKSGTVQFSEAQNGRIGILEQQTQNTDLKVSVEELVALGSYGKKWSKKERAYRVEIALRRTGAYHLRHKSFHDLSGGEKQRASLSRLLCQEAGLILLDEPGSYLDQEGKRTLVNLLKDIHGYEMPSILAVTHDAQLVQDLQWPVLQFTELCHA